MAYELQMLHGVRPAAQKALAAEGETVARLPALRHRVVRLLHAPLGERPANLAFFLRSLMSRG